MTEIHVPRPFIPDVARCMEHFNVVMPMLVAKDDDIADAYLARVNEDDGQVVHDAVLRMIKAACEE